MGGTFFCCLSFHHNMILYSPHLNVQDSCLRTNSTTFDLNSGGCAIFMFELQSNQYWIFISEACTASSIFIWAASSPTAGFTLCSAHYVQVDRKYFEYLYRIFLLDSKLERTTSTEIRILFASYKALPATYVLVSIRNILGNMHTDMCFFISHTMSIYLV